MDRIDGNLTGDKQNVKIKSEKNIILIKVGTRNEANYINKTNKKCFINDTCQIFVFASTRFWIVLYTLLVYLNILNSCFFCLL